MAAIVEERGKVYRRTYMSLDDFAIGAVKAYRNSDNLEKMRSGADRRRAGRDDSWDCGIDTLDKAVALAQAGWEDGVTEALPVAEEAIRQVEAKIETLEFESIWDVTGSEVDVGRYVEGVPENMVEYTTVPVSNAGKVVTLCASTCYSGSLTAKSVLRRGAAIVGLALALEKAGHAVELWADMSCEKNGGRVETRVLVKGAHDLLDSSKVAYAYAHPTMLRRLWFADGAAAPSNVKRRHDMPGSYGMPSAPTEDLPDGTIYLPALKTHRDIEDPERFIFDKLRELDLIAA